MIDHRGERRRLARSGCAHHQDEPALQHHQLFQDLGHAEVLEPRHLRRDVTQHHGGKAALVEDVDPEAPESHLGQREIDLQLFVEILDLFRGHETERRLADRLGTQNLLVDREDLALDLDLDRRVAGEEEVGCLLLDHEFE